MDFNQFAALVEKPTKMDVTVAIFALKRREINVGAFGIQMENVEEKTYAFFLNNEMVCFFYFENVNTTVMRYRESIIATFIGFFFI